MPLLLLLCACGDSLLSGQAADQLLDDAPLPEEAAWRIRWLGEGAVFADCSLEPIEEDAAQPIFGQLELPIPEIPEPPIWNSGGGFDWALGLTTLVDVEAFLPPEDLEGDWVDEDGTWGVSETRAFLYVEGDLDAAEQALVAGEPERSLTEAGWVDWVPQLIALTGRAEGALVLFDDEDDDLLITQVEYITEATEEAISGGFGDGLEPLPCPEEE